MKTPSHSDLETAAVALNCAGLDSPSLHHRERLYVVAEWLSDQARKARNREVRPTVPQRPGVDPVIEAANRAANYAGEYGERSRLKSDTEGWINVIREAGRKSRGK